LSALRVTILCPHVRVAGGVRAILTYADRLALNGHDVEIRVPTGSAVRAWWRNARGSTSTFIGSLTARVSWVGRWHASRLREADVLLATAWQSAPVVANATRRAAGSSTSSSTTRALHGRRTTSTKPIDCRSGRS